MANPNLNRIDTVITPSDLKKITDGILQSLTTLDNYTKTLVEDERKSLFSLESANLVFAQDALAQAQLLMAGFPLPLQMVVTNMATDFTLRDQLDGLYTQAVAQLSQRIEDTRRLANHEAYTAALAIYKYIETGAALGLEGYEAAYEILKKRFEGQGGSKAQTEV